MTGSFNRSRQGALLGGGQIGVFTRLDSTGGIDEFLQHIHIFVVDFDVAVGI